MISITAFIVVGLFFLYFGAEGLVRGSARLALRMGLTPLVVGLTIVAFGTSSPEMAVSLKAGLAGNSDIALGNVVGSNIFNILAILGLTGLIRPVPMIGVNGIDLAVMVGVAFLALPLMRTGFRLNRAEGGLLLLIYAGYLAWLIH